jgi:hypothetical protein
LPPRTRAYVEWRTQEGLSKPEIVRCLKCYVARNVFHTLSANPQDLHARDGRGQTWVPQLINAIVHKTWWFCREETRPRAEAACIYAWSKSVALRRLPRPA